MPLLRRANVYNQNYIKIRVNNLSESYSSGSLSGLFTLPGFPRDYTISRAGLFPRLSELPSRAFPDTLRIPEPGFSRDSLNSGAGFFPGLSELPSRAFPRDSPNSRTYDITIIPGYSRTYIIIRIYLILPNKCLPRLYKLHSPPHGGFTHIILFSIIADNYFLVISTMAFHIIIKLNTNDKLYLHNL